MAIEGKTNSDMKAHAKSYSQFVQMFKWGTIITFILTMFVVFVLIA